MPAGKHRYCLYKDEKRSLKKKIKGKATVLITDNSIK
jgi:hypothetical protein